MVKLGRITNYHFHYNAFPETFNTAKVLRKNMTEAEKIIWKELRNRNLAGYKIRRQHPVGQYIVDFYCAGKGLVIELDGGIHKDPEKHEKDQNRAAELDRLGLRVIRFTNQEVYNVAGGVRFSISTGKPSPIPFP